MTRSQCAQHGPVWIERTWNREAKTPHRLVYGNRQGTTAGGVPVDSPGELLGRIERPYSGFAVSVRRGEEFVLENEYRFLYQAVEHAKRWAR